MIDWQKLQPLYERKAYRIVQKHIKTMLQSIPYKHATFQTYEYIIQSAITEKQIKEMLTELYSAIGLNYGNRINEEIDKIKKAHILFNEYLLNEILVFLSKEGGAKITSIHDTLIADIIKAIKDQLGENATVIQLRDAIYKIVNSPTTFYKYQALRIARTETTAASGLAAMKTAQNADVVMTKEWIAADDSRTRHDHRYLNGKIVDLEDSFLTDSGATLEYPGDPSAPASEVINCRCTLGFKGKRDSNGMLIMKQ